MCPDPQLLSIYLDGELPSPWKEKLEDHFAQCSVCKEKLENYRRLQALFHKDKTAHRTYVERADGDSSYTEQELSEIGNSAAAKAKERVWKKLESRKRFAGQHLALLRRRLSVPLPAAAAAAVIIALLAALWLSGGNNNSIIASQSAEFVDRANFILAAEEEIPGIIPAADMSGVLQYLTPDGANIIILQLPESKNFFRVGEPAIIRAADFHGRGQ